MFGTLLAQLIIMKVLMVLIGNGTLERSVGGLLYPYALAPLVISALLGKNQGIYAAIFVSLWGATLTSLMDATFLAMSLISGFVAVFVTLQIRKRSQFLRAGFYVGLVTWLCWRCRSASSRSTRCPSARPTGAWSATRPWRPSAPVW